MVVLFYSNIPVVDDQGIIKCLNKTLKRLPLETKNTLQIKRCFFVVFLFVFLLHNRLCDLFVARNDSWMTDTDRTNIYVSFK